MEHLLYCTLNLFCIMILAMILARMCRSVDKRLGQIMLMCFIVASIILCTADIIWGIVDYQSSWINMPEISYMVNGIYHIFTGVVCYLWFLFCESEQNSRVVKTKTGIVLSMIPFLALVGMVVLSYKFNLVFYIDSNGIYHRGTHYPVLIGICFVYIMFASVKVLIKSFFRENYMERNRYKTLASFCVIPLITGVLQVLFVGSPMLSAGLAFAVLQIYMDSMEQLISVDPMTMLNNRSQMEKHLDHCMKNRSDKQTLYLFIMDLDYFKKINDTYGHVEGDEALVMAADAIRNVIGRTNYFACRYGGDEFVVIAEVDTESEFKPKGFIADLNSELENLSERRAKDYVLHFSVGYKRLDSSIQNVADFIEKADEGLYRIKKAREHIVEIV